MKLSLWQQFQLFVTGQAFLRYDKPEGYSDYAPIYAVKCKSHGVYEDTPHGHNGYFTCPECLRLQKAPSFSLRVATSPVYKL